MDAERGALADLHSALDRRATALAEGDAEGVDRYDQLLSVAVRVLGNAAAAPVRDVAAEPPPRPIARAFATALFAAPHAARTLVVEPPERRPPSLRATPAVADALGLPVPELEELREAVDVGAARALRQARGLRWLWSQGGDPTGRPAALHRLLFPVDGGPETKRFQRRGARLYASVPIRGTLPPEALFLPWLPVGEAELYQPQELFRARWVEAPLLRAMEQALGLRPSESEQLLDNGICPVPEGHENHFLRHDRWRSDGWSELCGLGAAADTPAWLSLRVAPDALDDEPWIERHEASLAVTAPRRVFDRHALTRSTAVAHALYAELMARAVEGSSDPKRFAALLDVGPALEGALQPLLDWTERPEVHQHLADRLGAPVAAVASTLAQARQVWDGGGRDESGPRGALAGWCARPSEQRPTSVAALLTTHLVVTQLSLQRLLKRAPDRRGDHRHILLLFVATWLREAPLSRLWRSDDGRLPPMEDVAATWFWGTWQRVLDAVAFEDR